MAENWNEIEKKISEYANTQNPNIEEISDLFLTDEMESYARGTSRPEAYTNLFNGLSDIMSAYLGEPLYCIELISILSYPATKIMHERFKDEPQLKSAIQSFLCLSLDHMFHDTQDIDMDELEEYLPMIKPWAICLSDDQIYSATRIGIETSLETIQMDMEDVDEDDEEEEAGIMAEQIKYKIGFIREIRNTLYERIGKEIFSRFPAELISKLGVN